MFADCVIVLKRESFFFCVQVSQPLGAIDWSMI